MEAIHSFLCIQYYDKITMIKIAYGSQVYWHTHVILEFGRLGQEDYEFDANLSYTH
jgi:hypothetical protein